MSALKSTPLDDQDILEKYLIICNQVLDGSADRFPYAQMWQACETELKDKKLLISTDANNVYSVCFHLGHFHWQRVTSSEPALNIHQLDLDEIKAVLACPKDYFDKPYLMNWDWLSLKNDAPKLSMVTDHHKDTH